MAEKPGNLKGMEQRMEEGEKVREEKRNGEENRIEKGEKGERGKIKEKADEDAKINEGEIKQSNDRKIFYEER